MSYIKIITNNIIENFSKEIKKDETKNKIINNLIDPIFQELSNRYFYHLLFLCFLVILNFIFLIIIIILNYKKNS
jgi:hypothetical protein